MRKLPSAPSAALLALLAGTLVACTSPSGTPGEFGYGAFRYECVTWGDPMCDGDPAPVVVSSTEDEGSGNVVATPRRLPLPGAIVAGGLFDVEFRGSSSSDTNAVARRGVLPAAPRIAERVGDAILAGQGGMVALVAADERRAVDLVHQLVLPVTQLRLILPPSDVLVPNRPTRIDAVPVSAGGAELAGALTWNWEVSDPTILSLYTVNNLAFDQDTSGAVQDDTVFVVGSAPGTATLTVTVDALGLSATSTWRVQ